MDREEFIRTISDAIKHIRVNRGLTQDGMAELLGISKKTLVQIEKGRIQAGWTTAVACCAIFRNEETLQMTLGGNPLDLVDIFSAQNPSVPGMKTMGGRVWWRKAASVGDYVLQQNVISQHYRILDTENRRWFSSFEEAEARQRLQELAGAGDRGDGHDN